MSRGFANPLTELAEFEELQQSLKKKKGPEGAPDAGDHGGPAMEAGGNL